MLKLSVTYLAVTVTYITVTYLAKVEGVAEELKVREVVPELADQAETNSIRVQIVQHLVGQGLRSAR